ncbi:thioesterase domain-containing protein [Solwaraspora sp. WMMD406]|uniref:thioesterase II family protein n=1 Tax=Solwaraspora sp. WMMD406 TaxID=3016095 RepID=UPI002415BFF2|nr:thioesterase domain-containing protein [Solwaraspora sp. WMMD406]MDG4765804.1 thioesterase domain-containing protein [Solwaraspora sp. WMMD406]
MSGWLLRRPDRAAGSYLFCLPYSGVGASMYARWPRHIGPAQICPVQPPARENRIAEPHYGTYEALAESLAADLLPWLDRPYALFGHCSSALACYATALHLHRSGARPPVRLFVSSQVAPHDGPHGRFLTMTDGELAEELASLVRAMGGEPNAAYLDMWLDVLRADVAANRRYRLERPRRLPVAITVIGWSDDREVPTDLMDGWSSYSDQVRYVTLSGGHHSFLSAPLALRGELAADLKESVDAYR